VDASGQALLRPKSQTVVCSHRTHPSATPFLFTEVLLLRAGPLSDLHQA
jgi:hypothetical protein